MTKRKSGTQEMRQTMDTLSDALSRQMDLSGDIVSSLAQTTRRFLSTLAPKTGAGSCDIPEPCWMPQDLGEYHCALCPGSAGTMDIRVTNTDFKARSFTVAAAGADAGRISLTPNSFTLGPKERRTIKARFDTTLDDKSKCDAFEALIWVVGCNSHYLRWTIDVGTSERPCCHHVEVHDQPDYVHHWYDHFYCTRRCFGEPSRLPTGKRDPVG